MANLLDNVRFNPSAGGTTDWTFSSVSVGYQTPSAAGVVNGAKYKYFAISADLSQWEIGEGVYNTSAPGTLSRATVLYNSSGTTSKINFTAPPQVAVVALLEDLIPAQSQFGLGMAGGTLVASVASNVLTVAVKTFAGNDPSPSDPVFFFFRDATVANGDYVCRIVTSALSINTNAVGASLGTANSVPFRFWVTAFDNAGTVVLALWQSITNPSAPSALGALDETSPASTTGMSASATAAATFYTPNGVALTSASFRILGYVEYGAGLATAGTYASAPTKIQLFSRGCKLPGDTIQTKFSFGTTATTGNGAWQATGNAISITPTSAPNMMEVDAVANVRMASSGAPSYATQLRRGTSVSLGVPMGAVDNGGSFITCPANNSAFDIPGVTSSTTYTHYFNGTSGASYPEGNQGGGYQIKIKELMV